MSHANTPSPGLSPQLRYWLGGWRRTVVPTSPLYLTFFVTGRCNATCPQCFYAEHNIPENAAQELTLEEVELFTGKLANLPVLLLSGGEPTLRDDIPELVGAFHRNAGTHHVTLPTNGLLPEKTEQIAAETLAACPGTKLTFQLAVDEIGERHDDLRGVPGAFAKLLDTHQRLVRLQERHAELAVAFCLTFSPYNQERVPDIFEELARITGSTELRILLSRGTPRDPTTKGWEIDEFERAVEGMFDVIARREPRPSLSRALFLARQRNSERAIVRTVREGRGRAPCLAGRVNAVLDEVGNVFACELLGDSLGNLRDNDYSMERIFASPAAAELRRRIRRTRCFCTHETNVITNTSFVPSLWPRIVGDTLRFKLDL